MSLQMHSVCSSRQWEERVWEERVWASERINTPRIFSARA